MFYGCNSLISLDLSNFDFSNLYFSTKIFNNLTSLKELKLSNIKTNITDMSYLFSDLNKLISLNLSDFDTSSVIKMDYMFANYYKLTYLDLSNFNTENVKI